MSGSTVMVQIMMDVIQSLVRMFLSRGVTSIPGTTVSRSSPDEMPTEDDLTGRQKTSLSGVVECAMATVVSPSGAKFQAESEISLQRIVIWICLLYTSDAAD